MSRSIHCRRCGARFPVELHEVVARVTRLCPHCRGPLPPTGSVPVADGLLLIHQTLHRESAS